jgi:hypothetical protein
MRLKRMILFLPYIRSNTRKYYIFEIGKLLENMM